MTKWAHFPREPNMQINSLNIGKRALFSYRARYNAIAFSNCHIERSKDEIVCVV